MSYEKLKALFWPHTVLPMLLMISIDYVKLLGVFIQVFAAAYLIVQLLAFPAGFAVAAFGQATALKDIFKIRLAKYLPLLGGGKRLFEFLMEDEKSEA